MLHYVLLMMTLMTASWAGQYNEFNEENETHPVMVCKSLYYDKTTEVPLYSDTSLTQGITLADYLKAIPQTIYVAIPRNQYGIKMDDPVMLLPLHQILNSKTAQISYAGFIEGVSTTIVAKNYPQTVTTTVSDISFNLSWSPDLTGKKLKFISATLTMNSVAKTERFQGKTTTIADPTLKCFLVTKKDLKRYPSLR